MRISLGWMALAVLIVGCQKDAEVEVRKTSESVKATVRGIYRLENSVPMTLRPSFTSIDVAGLTAKELQSRLSSFTNAATTHVWMPGEKSWIIVQHKQGVRIRLDHAMKDLAEDSSCILSLPEIFASYAGCLDQILPAFDAKLEGEVVPEWFVTKEIPEIGWLDFKNVDADILHSTTNAIKSMQHARRLVLEGMMLSRVATDRKQEEAIADKWSTAMKYNSNDSMLLERLEILERNALGFLELNKVLQAMKCYEMIVLVNPKNVAAIRNFGMCLKKIGRVGLAQQVLEHAEELSR